MTRLIRLALLSMLLACPGALRAADVTATGRATFAPDRVAMLFYMRQEISDDATAAEQQLAVTWKQAQEWLANSSFKDEQIILGDAVTTQFNDQKKYVVRRVTLVQKIDPGQRDETLQTLAKLIDQASSRGLLPASQLYQLAVYGSPFQQEMSFGNNSVNHATYFVLYLPPEKSDLVQQATKDAAANLRAAITRHAQAVGADRPRTTQLQAMEPQAATTDFKANRYGPCTPSLGNVPAACTLTASVRLFGPEAPDAQTLSATGAGLIDLPIERGHIGVRIYAGEGSFQKALDNVLDQLKKADDKLKAEKGAIVENDGVAFFCGYLPMLNLPNTDDGQPPSGVYCDLRVTLDRRDGEAEADFRQRIEKLAAALHPHFSPPDQVGDQPALAWGPKDPQAFVAQATQKALADARSNAQQIIAAVGGKLGELVDVQATPDPTAYPQMAPQIEQINMMGQGPQLSQLSNKPQLQVQVTARFLADLP